MNRGIILALGAYIFWGVHPLYWKQLQHVPSYEIVSHRIFWSLVFFVLVVSFRKEWKTLWSKVQSSNRKWLLFLPAFLIGSNWATYIWAVNAGHIIETSLGYFISPLINVFLGVLVLKEHLRKLQWAAIAIVGISVLTMTFVYGHFPWIALYLAGTWGLYGLLRKKSPLNSVEGLTLETGLLSIAALGYLFFLKTTGNFSFLLDWRTSIFLMGTGLISGVPLIMFINGARMINLSLIGILQYIYPTLIFIIGYFVYGEVLDEAKLIGFVFIWLAIVLYTGDSFGALKQKALRKE